MERLEGQHQLGNFHKSAKDSQHCSDLDSGIEGRKGQMEGKLAIKKFLKLFSIKAALRNENALL